jgi:tRNA (uracil-5-)-methyltransferase
MRVTQIDSTTYSEQLAKKIKYVSAEFNEFNLPTLEVFESPPLHYRMRAEFRVWHEGDDLYHIMFDKDTKQSYRVDQMPAASKLINDVMATLIKLIRDQPVLRHRLFQIDYLSTLSNQIIVSMVYHRQLDDEWNIALKQLLAVLTERFDIHIIGRARKQKIVTTQDYVNESLPINGRDYSFKHIENSFTQPNAVVNCSMIEWALSKTRNANHDLLELYCGLGNFTLPLAQNFEKVLATEISKSSVNAANHNIKQNGIDNVTVIRMSSEELTQAMNQERVFNRLNGLDVRSFNCKTVLVDPPRSGVDPNTLELISQYDNIVYISCNPATLKDNLCKLTETHELVDFAVFDQFPYTEHLECGVYLNKKSL